MSTEAKKKEFLARVVFAHIKDQGKGAIVDLDAICLALVLAVTVLNRQIAELVERGLVTRSIDATNPAKRKMHRAVQLTKLGQKTAPKAVTPKPKPVTELQTAWWRYLRRYQCASIRGSLGLISKPEIHPQNACRDLQPWVIWLESAGYIVAQQGGGEVRLWDRTYCLAKDNGPDAPLWVVE